MLDSNTWNYLIVCKQGLINARQQYLKLFNSVQTKD